jgi:hypothetical protein
MSGDIELVIDTLVLRGFNPLQGEAIRGFAIFALAKMISENGTQNPAESRKIATVDARQISIDPSLPPRIVGEQIAKAIYLSVNHGQ